MGDRCYLEVYVATVHVERFSQIVFGESAIKAGFEHFDGAMLTVDDQADWGLYDELLEAAEAGCIFEGNHGAGSNYGGAMFAAYGGKVAYISTDGSGESMVPVNPAWLANEKDAPIIHEHAMHHLVQWKETIYKVGAVNEYLMAKEAEKVG